MPTLNWIGKDKIVNHDKEVPFRLLKKNKKFSLGESENLIVEGDNLEALKALMPFYHGSIKCIYIDPPYNTGNEKWVYNDKVNSPKIKEWLGKVVGPEGEDLTRNDKWLCMMYPRLKLLHDLLSDEGVIFVSIDDNEQHFLRILMNEIFGEKNFVSCILWQKKYAASNDAKGIAMMHDYILVYQKSSQFERNLLPRTDSANAAYKNDDKDGRGLWRSDNLLVKSFSASSVFPIVNPNTGKQYLPPEGKCWRGSRETISKWLKERRIFFGKDGKGAPQLKRYLSEVQQGVVPTTWWTFEFGGHNDEAKKEIEEIFSKKTPFDTPKPVKLIKKILELSTNKSSIILDSFAGSGTTAHAVLELNKEDGGNRKFILVEMESDICRKITSERVRRVAKGYSYKKVKGEAMKVKGLGGGFEYTQLGDSLFNADGTINEKVTFEDMARYVYFTETHTNLDKNKIKGNYIGGFADTYYFLLFDGIGKNVLNRNFLKKLKTKEGRKIVYADKCLIDEEILEKHQIIFKQIPYQVKVY